METGQAQMAYFRATSEREFDVPGKGPRRFTATAMKAWLYRYRKHGFTGLIPRTRSDQGTFRLLPAALRERIKELRQEHLDQSCVKFYDRCLREKCLGDPPICMETLRRYLKSENLYKTRSITARKRFEMSTFGELWTCDFMHGPQVLEVAGGKRRKKAILLAIIDDHSRLIVGGKFGFFETTQLIEQVFKEAILAHGLPDRLYCDNGAAFSSQYLSRVCAHVGIGLVHSKPYDSPSRGKIERFFRTVRLGFLSDLGAAEQAGLDLARLNEGFARWLRDSYHHALHRGISARPIDRYQISIRAFPRRRVAEETLDEFFFVTAERTVAKDSTVSLHGVDYEVPPEYIGRRVELKFAQDTAHEIYLYDNGVRITRVLPVDSVFNGRKPYTPSPRISDVALHAVDTPKSAATSRMMPEEL